ncbi:P-loop containing nucleoside triphosphate hydrolase protein [Syncephalis pseudoplumigaleata]|uniref:Vesicular-fusion protein SEC18 n=1 Tax=Syncephalis pseudoplumigaleata TaxID=1712513 RepID=A0A4P9Z7N1_9FUNG|nr:P-loop containing nucleoside triphosphate hydrolase protein [Syncephalis pseudoplumigaleata]|eukprot:RKP27921.1 P-loop containing nucleoside triphosphate hydrolase protein [Syncephalis pseudoplumigaleata]
MKVAKSPSEALALTNRLVVSPRDFDQKVHYVIVNGQFVFTVYHDHAFPSGQIGSSKLQRRWAMLSLGQDVDVEPYDPRRESDHYILNSLSLEVGFLKVREDQAEHFDVQEMSQLFSQTYAHQMFSVKQQIVFDFHGVNLVGVVTGVELLDLEQDTRGGQEQRAFRGVLVPETIVNFSKAAGSPIRLKGAARQRTQAIIDPNFRFEDMGVGGLDKEFSSIFRRAFASRIFPPSLVEKLGIPHVKGILLYGPPGTGKTLMARQIGSMLNAQEPKIVNGPEILNKFVGQSEENIRNLFKDAEAEYKEKGEESSLHIIIFDELDAICRQRGGRSDGTGVGDSVVNQLLSKMDGVDQLNNILIIGMTNRLDMIDEALLRPGRLEVHMEISLPDEDGRYQILTIHTARMRDNNIIAEDVDFHELAALTKNYSGAEINGVVKSAASFAFNRHVKVGTLASVTPDVDSMRIQREDFMAALDEVKPSFGVSDDELGQCVTNSIIHFNRHIERILKDAHLYTEQVKTSVRTPVMSVLLHGPPGSGKTALAATMAMASDFPFIKLVSPEAMVGYSENAKINAITKIFNDAYKSPQSVVVVDNIERLLDWVPMNNRFSNGVLQALLVLFQKRPPKASIACDAGEWQDNRRLLILATTSQRAVLSNMNMMDTFDADICVYNVRRLREVETVITELGLFTDEEIFQAMQQLQQSNIEDRLNIGIKKLITMAETARQDSDKVGRFVELLSGPDVLLPATYDVDMHGVYMAGTPTNEENSTL